MDTNVVSKMLEIVERAFEEFNTPNYRLSNVMRKAIRLARLRNDYDNLWWLEYEMISTDDKSARDRVIREIIFHYTSEQFKLVQKKVLEAYADERKLLSPNENGELVDEGMICVRSISEIESQIDYFTNKAEKTVPPAGLHPVDLYFMEESYSKTRSFSGRMAEQYRAVLQRIEHRTHDYLSLAEKQLMFGQINSDIFEQNRRYVDARLNVIAPQVLEQFTTVYRRMGEGDSEARSQALLSCRRILKSLADDLYPPRKEPLITPDGKKRLLTDERYIARLWQFVGERVKGTATGNLLLAQLDDLGSRIDRVYELSNKGTHADVSEFEVNQGVIQTYLLIGDILRVEDQESAVYSEVS